MQCVFALSSKHRSQSNLNEVLLITLREYENLVYLPFANSSHQGRSVDPLVEGQEQGRLAASSLLHAPPFYPKLDRNTRVVVANIAAGTNQCRRIRNSRFVDILKYSICGWGNFPNSNLRVFVPCKVSSMFCIRNRLFKCEQYIDRDLCARMYRQMVAS